ncbi:hypothetical protein DVH24_015490 [Malus domestica]|uniref:Uncharacterized protein n=1 Tax=Malus domestica TaxID=3750 RepID=A0A498HH97_MALDO|nr:hypothetical protein DVH24_015490 [Malus domestica]
MLPPVFGFVSKRSSGVKFGSTFERLTVMNSRNVDFSTKVAPKHVPPSAAIDSFAEKLKYAYMGSCEKSTESGSEEFPECDLGDAGNCRKNEVNHVAHVVKDLERVNSELRSAYFTNEKELVFMHCEVSHLKDVASKFESKEMDLQGALFASENLKKELDKLHDAHTKKVMG